MCEVAGPPHRSLDRLLVEGTSEVMAAEALREVLLMELADRPEVPTVKRGEGLPPGTEPVQHRGLESHPRPGREGILDRPEPPSPDYRERYPARGTVGRSERSMAVWASGVGL